MLIATYSPLIIVESRLFLLHTYTFAIDCAGCEGPATCGKYIEHKMDKCPTRKPDDSYGSGRPNEVRYELTGKLEDLQDALSTWKGISPDVSLYV